MIGRAAILMAFASSALAVAPALAANDREFLRKALQGDNSEMRLGHIAAERGASSAVRAFGQMLETDHRMGRQEVLPIAQAAGLQGADEMAPEARQEEQKLAGLSGRAFDREFARYMVQDHKHDISDFEKEVRHGQGDGVRLARQTLPVLRKHLRTAERLSR